MVLAPPLLLIPLAIPTVAIGDIPPPVGAFQVWLAKARPGDSFEYHRGFLAHDRAPKEGMPETDDQIRLAVLADGVADAAGQEMVHLVQRRIAPGVCSYLAVRAQRRFGMRRAA